MKKDKKQDIVTKWLNNYYILKTVFYVIAI